MEDANRPVAVIYDMRQFDMGFDDFMQVLRNAGASENPPGNHRFCQLVVSLGNSRLVKNVVVVDTLPEALTYVDSQFAEY